MERAAFGADDKRHASGRPKRGSKTNKGGPSAPLPSVSADDVWMPTGREWEEECARVGADDVVVIVVDVAVAVALSVRRKQCKEFVFLLPAPVPVAALLPTNHVRSTGGVHLDSHEDAVFPSPTISDNSINGNVLTRSRLSLSLAASLRRCGRQTA